MLENLVEARPQALLERRDFGLILASTVGVFTAYNLVLPVLPLAVIASGGPRAAAGIATAATAGGTILLDLTAARVNRHVSERTVMLAGLGLALVSAFGLAAATALWVVVVAALGLGVGFGAMVTTASIAIATRAPAQTRGRLFGGYGTATTAPSIYGPGGALLLNAMAGPRVVFLLAGVSCALAVAAVVPIRLTRIAHATTRESAPVRRWFPVAVPWLAFFGVTLAYGGVVGFSALLLPGRGMTSAAVFLVVFGVTRAVVRTASGPLVDMRGGFRALVGALLVASSGLVLLALTRNVLVLLAAVLFGVGFAAAQNASFAEMVGRAREADRASVAGMWNFAIDIGVVVAAAIVAPFGAVAGFERTPWLLLGATILGVIVLALEGGVRRAYEKPRR